MGLSGLPVGGWTGLYPGDLLMWAGWGAPHMDVLQPIQPQLQKDFHIPTEVLQGRQGDPTRQKPLSWVAKWPELAHLPALESSN